MRPRFERGLRRSAATAGLNPALGSHTALRCAVLACAIVGGALVGCEKTSSDAPAALEPCKEVGQRCEYGPGKLGACVLRDGCQGENCFVCQSQH